MKLSGFTRCGMKWRIICTNRKHPDRKNIMVLIDKGHEEVCVCVSSLKDIVKSQWLNTDVYLLGE